MVSREYCFSRSLVTVHRHAGESRDVDQGAIDWSSIDLTFANDVASSYSQLNRFDGKFFESRSPSASKELEDPGITLFDGGPSIDSTPVPSSPLVNRSHSSSPTAPRSSFDDSSASLMLGASHSSDSYASVSSTITVSVAAQKYTCPECDSIFRTPGEQR